MNYPTFSFGRTKAMDSLSKEECIEILNKMSKVSIPDHATQFMKQLEHIKWLLKTKFA